MPELTLTIDGAEHGGWLAVSVTRALDTLAASFSVSLTDRWSAEQTPRPISEFAPVIVCLDGVQVIDGYVDSVSPSYDSETHSVVVSGRSRTGQLADCCAVLETGELRGQSLRSAAQKLSIAHGVHVRSDVDAAAQPFERIEIEPGERIAELLERLAQQRGVFLTDNENGDLVITRRGDRLQGSFKDGDWRKASATLDGTGQYSDVTVKGQREGSDSWSGEAAAAPVGRSRDAAVPLHRPLVILSEAQGDPVAFQERAQFEVALRRGRSRVWDYEFDGWFRPDGLLWQPGELVHIKDRFMGLDDDLLCVGATFDKDDGGTQTRLRLGQPEGYDLRAIPEQKAEATGWTG